MNVKTISQVPNLMKNNIENFKNIQKQKIMEALNVKDIKDLSKYIVNQKR